MQSIAVRHNIEMAHRLPNLEGKCQQIHGHSWWCELELTPIASGIDPSAHGVIIDFGTVKDMFRSYLDANFDHHLALSADDPLIHDDRYKHDAASPIIVVHADELYPGLVIVPDDPTVENMSRWIGEYMRTIFGLDYAYRVDLWEAATNKAVWTG